MEKMTLKEARVLKARLGKELDRLVEKRDSVAVVTIMPGEDPMEFIDVTVDEVTKKIDDCIERLIEVGRVIRLANVGATACGKDKDIATMVERTIVLRKEAKCCNVLGSKNPRMRDRSSFRSDCTELVDVTTYNIGKYAERARQLSDEAEKLSTEVDRLDLETIVEV